MHRLHRRTFAAALSLLLSAACGQGVPDEAEADLAAPASMGITNGGFESGLTGWRSKGSVSTSATAHGGAAAALVGSSGPSRDSSLSQTFNVPAGGGTLSLWVNVACADTVQHDWATVTLADLTARTTVTLLPRTCSNSGAWTQLTSAALPAGHTVKLTLANHDDRHAGDPTHTLVDDVEIISAGPPPPPPPPGGCTTSLDCTSGKLCSSGTCVESACDQRASGKTGMRAIVQITRYQGLITGRNGTHEIAFGTISNTEWVFSPSTVDTSNVQLAMNVASSTDPSGLPHEIPLSPGQSIEVEGEYINAATAGSSGDAVIHFTHSTCGFVDINNTIYP